MGIRWRHDLVRVVANETFPEQGFLRFACLYHRFLTRPPCEKTVCSVEAELCLALLLIRSMAGKAISRQYRLDIAIEADL